MIHAIHSLEDRLGRSGHLLGLGRVFLREHKRTHLDQLTGFILVLFHRFLEEPCLNALKFGRVLAVQDFVLRVHIFFDPVGYETDDLGTHVTHRFKPSRANAHHVAEPHFLKRGKCLGGGLG